MLNLRYSSSGRPSTMISLSRRRRNWRLPGCWPRASPAPSAASNLGALDVILSRHDLVRIDQIMPPAQRRARAMTRRKWQQSVDDGFLGNEPPEQRISGDVVARPTGHVACNVDLLPFR